MHKFLMENIAAKPMSHLDAFYQIEIYNDVDDTDDSSNNNNKNNRNNSENKIENIAVFM